MNSLKWGYVFRLTAFATGTILLGMVVILVVLCGSYGLALTRWGCLQPRREPTAVDLTDYQTVELQPQPDQTLTAWYVPSQNGAAVLLLQGHWMARDGMLKEAAMLARHGYGVMLIDPHTCAKPGTPHTMGYAEVNDVAAAIRFLQSRPDLESGRLGILGFSIGGVIAVESAARIPAIQAVVAQGNFHDLTVNLAPRGADDTLFGRLVAFLILSTYRLSTGVDPQLVKPINSVANISPRSIFFIAGEWEIKDNHTLAQFEAAGEPKQLWIVPEVAHGGYMGRWPEEYEERVTAFFDEALLEP